MQGDIINRQLGHNAFLINLPMKSPHRYPLAIEAVVSGLPHGDCTNNCCGCCDQLRNHPAGHKDNTCIKVSCTTQMYSWGNLYKIWFVQLQCSNTINMSCYTIIWQSQLHKLVVIQTHHHMMILHIPTISLANTLPNSFCSALRSVKASKQHTILYLMIS